MEDETNIDNNIIEKHENEPMGNKNLEDLEQKVHELDSKWKQVKEERDSIMVENEELQEQLDMANSAQSAGNVRMSEFRNDLNKVTEEVTKLEYMCTSQEHELKTLSDKMCDLNSIKETVKVCIIVDTISVIMISIILICFQTNPTIQRYNNLISKN